MPIVADAAVRIGADLTKFKQDLGGLDRQTQTLGQRMKSTFSPGGLGFTAAAVGIGAFTAGIGQAVGDLINMERISAQTDAAIRSTGGAANVTREEIVALAEGMEELTGTEMETVQTGANMLLTFTKVRNEVGKGNDVFDQATEAALNMSVALGTDMQSAALMVGKALNDPVKGMTAMTRAGIQFTEQQKNMITSLVESGDLLGAQTIILKELEVQFGGSAEAFGQTTAGKMQKFQNAVGNFFEGVVTGAVDMVQDTSGLLNNFAMDSGDMAMRIHGVAESVGTDFTAVKDHIRNNMAETGASFEDAAAAAELHFETIRMEAKVAAAGVTEAMSEGVRFAAEELQRGGPVVAIEAGKIAGMLPSEIKARDQAIRDAAYQNIVQFAAGILDAQNAPKLAMDALALAQDTALSRQAEIAFLKGQLTSTELADGLNDERPAVRLAAQAARAVILERLETLGGSAYGWGLGIGNELARGMDAANERVRRASRDMSSATGSAIRIESEPPDRGSGLYGITKWGGNLVRTYVEGIYGEMGSLVSAAQAMSQAVLPGLVGASSTPGASPLAFGGAVGGMGPSITVISQSLVPGGPAERRAIVDAITPLVDEGLTRNSRLPRRPRN